MKWSELLPGDFIIYRNDESQFGVLLEWTCADTYFHVLTDDQINGGFYAYDMPIMDWSVYRNGERIV